MRLITAYRLLMVSGFATLVISFFILFQPYGEWSAIFLVGLLATLSGRLGVELERYRSRLGH